jgi:NAD(P)H dehydrogenase (quinone)
MKTHIVFAHPNLQSYNGQLKDIAIQALDGNGWTVSVSNLYQMKFKASADEDDFTELYNSDFFDLQTEQQAATQKQTYSADILREHQLLSEADLIIFQFPLWWYSMPALLKGYIDRVFSMGWAYGGGQALAGKKILVSMTTGAPDFAWTEEKRGTIKDIFKHLFVGTFGLCGMQALEPFIVYGAKRQTEQDKLSIIEHYKKRLTELMR